MAVLSLEFSDEEFNLIKEYSSVQNVDISSFVRELILDELKELDRAEEKRISDLWQKSKSEKTYSANAVFEELYL